MSLKCPFCGKEYYHDRKICQTCENKSINNINIPENYTYVHYEQTTAFGRKKPDEEYATISDHLGLELKFNFHYHSPKLPTPTPTNTPTPTATPTPTPPSTLMAEPVTKLAWALARNNVT